MSAPSRRLQDTARIMGALWIGGLWALGYAAVPLLFWRFPQAIAGSLAGDLFALWQGLGLIFGGFVVAAVRGRGRPWLLIAWITFGLDAIFELVILPVMVFLRSAPGFGPHSPTWGLFMGLHGLATLVYLSEGLLGLSLVARAL
ncbi:MAG: DUF4149 domain-containing protein [Acidiferrobacter sp.]